MFDEAISVVLNNEGGYVNDEADNGKETYKGISRVYNPNWKGWEIIDNYRHIVHTQKSTLKEIVDNSRELENMAIAYYKIEFWQKLIEPLKIEDKRVNIYLFDMCINIGSWAKILQRAINKCGANLEVDGAIGDMTKEALKGVDTKELLSALVEYRTKHYVNIAMDNNKTRYLKGWVNRSFNI